MNLSQATEQSQSNQYTRKGMGLETNPTNSTVYWTEVFSQNGSILMDACYLERFACNWPATRSNIQGNFRDFFAI